MEEEDREERQRKLDAELGSMSREELIMAVRESIQRYDELESSSKLLVTHLKVLCFKNGGKLTYTKDEFNAAAKEDPSFNVEYGVDGNKEVCVLQLLPREKRKNSA